MGCGAHFINSKPEVLRAAFNAIPLGFECDKCGTLAEYVALQRAAAKKLRGS